MRLYRFFASARELKNFVNEKEGNSNLQPIRIVVENDLSEASKYTDKKNCALLDWDYNDQNAEILIAYIKEHLKICPRIELWRAGIGDKTEAVIKKCSKNILNKEKIKEIWGKDSFDETACLVVYNS